jgi:cell wall-associated NlpC family hydrolase
VSTFSTAAVSFALRQLGAPYLWSAQGDYMIGKAGEFIKLDSPAYDCAGLVKMATVRAGGPDLRSWWGADSLFSALPPADASERFPLVFYGAKGRASHVGIALGDTGLVLEASGGDSTTRTIADALHRDAKVRVGFNGRLDRLGFRSFDAMQFLHLHPSPGGLPNV